MNPIVRTVNRHKQANQQIQATASRMSQLYREARLSINRLLEAAVLRNDGFQGQALVALIEAVGSRYDGLESDFRDELGRTVPFVCESYFHTALQDIGKTITGKLDENRIKLFLTDAFTHVAGATNQMRASEVTALRQTAAAAFREQAFTGVSRAQVSREILNTLATRPSGFRFVDAKGRVWNSEAYTEMLGRTVLLNAGRQTYFDECARRCRDVVRVTVSGHPCPDCAVWENRLLSISGKTEGLPTVQAAMNAGLFHPNCTHSTVAVPPMIRDEDFDTRGRPNSGINSVGREETNDKAAWTKYREAEFQRKHRPGPLDDVLDKGRVRMERLPREVANDLQTQLVTLYSRYDSRLESVGTRAAVDDGVPGNVRGGKKMFFNPADFTSVEANSRMVAGQIALGQFAAVDSGNEHKYIATHEFAHTLFRTQTATPEQNREMTSLYIEWREACARRGDTVGLSGYADNSVNDFFAESFTQSILSSQPSEFARRVGEFADRYYRRKD